MKIFVLYDKSGIHSGRALGSYLINKLRGKATVYKGRPKRLGILQRKIKFDYIVNIGFFRNFDSKGAIILNNPVKISVSSNKRKARIKFKENDLPAPELWLSVPEKGYPIIGRTTHHSKGHGFWFCNNKKQANAAVRKGATHFLKYIANTREFRVHVVAPEINMDKVDSHDYVVVKLSEKLPKPGAKTNAIIKSHDRGWVFSYPKNRNDPTLNRVRNVAKKALSLFGLHWGAVDVMVCKKTGNPYVLEINSTPCLTDPDSNTLEKYADSITSLVGLGVPLKAKEKEVVLGKKNIKRDKRALANFLGGIDYVRNH